MNTSQFMDKQILGLSGSQQGSGGELFDLMNPEEEHQINGKKEEILPSYDFQPIRTIGSLPPTASAAPLLKPSWGSVDSKMASSNLKNAGILEPCELTKLSREKEKSAYDAATVAEIDHTVKKYADNLLHTLEGVSSRLTQLESRTHHLESSVDELKVTTGNSSGTTDGKLRQLENILRGVQTCVQVLRDKQEIVEAQLQLANLQASKGDNKPRQSVEQSHQLAVPPLQPTMLRALPAPNAPPPPPPQQNPPPQLHQPQIPSVPSLPREPYFPSQAQQSEATHQQYQVPVQQPQPPPLSPHYQPSTQLPQFSQPPQPPQPVNPSTQLQSPLPHHPEESVPYVSAPQTYPSSIRQAVTFTQPPSGPPRNQYYGPNLSMYEPPTSIRTLSGPPPPWTSLPRRRSPELRRYRSPAPRYPPIQLDLLSDPPSPLPQTMDEFPGLLARDFGFRPQGKNAPMAASKAASVGGVNLGTGSTGSSAASTSWNKSRSGWNSTGDSLFGDHGVGISDNRSPPAYDDVFGGPPSYSNSTSHGRSGSATSPPLDSIFEGFKDSGAKPATSSSLPVYDKPVYDDDIFDGVPGMKNSSVKYDDVFTSMSAGSNHVSSPPYDDLLENLGKAMPESKGANDKRSGEQKDQDLSGFEELIPGFGGSSPPHKREIPETNQQKAKPTASTSEDPFAVFETTSTSANSSSGLFNDPLEHISRTTNSRSTKTGASSARGAIFDDANVFDGFSNSMPSYTSEMNDNQDENPQNNVQGTSPRHRFGKEPPQRSSMDAFENITPKMQPTKSDTHERNAMADQSPKSDDHLERTSDRWLTVNEIPLSTLPTTAPPPSRPPPPLVIKQAPFGANTKRRENEPFSQSRQSYPYPKDSGKKSSVSPIDELEDFAMGKPQTYAHDHEEVFTNEGESDTNSAAAASAAAMKEAMNRAEAKIKHAREVRGRERAQQEKDEKAKSDSQEIEDKEKQERHDCEREQKEREEKEQKRLERERELALERERERARQAVERATREARERAAAEARAKAERAAYEKAAAEARQRAERAAVQRAAAEARERAAAEARQRAERTAAEAREKAAAAKERASAEAREKAAAERAAVERAAAEARMRAERAAVDRAHAEARERAAAAAREKQNKTENDLESFFSMGARANSAPKQRATSSETMFDTQAQGKGSSNAPWRTSSGSSSTMKKASSTTNITDDLSSIFGAPSSSGEFQEIEGESEERRKARFERHQRTLERAAKALAEKNERDLQTQREQAERHRIAETLDVEIKRWSAGKEGNLRALLSTLQYVLWPECGWQPVSLTDLITAAAVKKVYRKATLCIHPDKVQQKGANLQQKYIAEKVFDLLKEAWNKFNSEELF